MKYRALFSVLAGCTGLNACTPSESVGYYETGEVAFRAPLDPQGHYRGDVTYFYKTGAVARIVPFAHGEVSGSVRRYYPTGELSAVEVWQQGRTDGSLKEYYRDGKLRFRGVRRDTVWRDTACWFYRNGELKDFKVYNQVGRMVDFGRYRPDGRKDTRFIYPIFISDTDSLRAGQDYAWEVVLGNRRTNAVTVQFVQPAIGIDSVKGRYAKTRYVIRRPSPGPHVVRVKVYEHWQRHDTLWTNWYGVEHAFYVHSSSKTTHARPH